jgi:agmatine deiminase
MQAIVIAWITYPDILAEIVRHARLECKVIICVRNASEEASAKVKLTAKGVDFATNVEFVRRDFNSIWIRDYGPNACYTNDVDSLVLVDWLYNRPRPKDDTLSNKIAEYLNLPIYVTNNAPNALVHTGGNFMTDGDGLGFSSNLVKDENGPNTTQLTEANIDTIMARHHGLSRYAKMTNLLYDEIHHIDMHMKLINEETLLVGEFPKDKGDYQQIEANIQYVLSQYRNQYGKPFRLVRVPMPPQNGQYAPVADYLTYANALIINKTILLPIYAHTMDSIAIKIWQAQMPGYKIVGINCNQMINASGAIHCITKEIAVNEPIWITYGQLPDIQSNTPTTTYPLLAKVKHQPGITEVHLYYKTQVDTLWKILSMISQGNDLYLADIPHQPDGSTVHYYVEAIGSKGKSIQKPITAPTGFYTFQILRSVATNEEVNDQADLLIFPNPAKAITCVEIKDMRGSEMATLSLYDMKGILVKSIHAGVKERGHQKYFFDARDLHAGTYLVRYITVEGTNAMHLVLVP